MDCRQCSLCYLAAAQLCSVKNCSLQQCSLPCSLMCECRRALWPIFVCNQRTCLSGPSEQVLCNTAKLCCPSSVCKHHSTYERKEAGVLTCTEVRLWMLSCSEMTRKKKYQTEMPSFWVTKNNQLKSLEGFSFKATYSALLKDDCFLHEDGDRCGLLGVIALPAMWPSGLPPTVLRARKWFWVTKRAS